MKKLVLISLCLVKALIAGDVYATFELLQKKF